MNLDDLNADDFIANGAVEDDEDGGGEDLYNAVELLADCLGLLDGLIKEDIQGKFLKATSKADLMHLNAEIVTFLDQFEAE